MATANLTALDDLISCPVCFEHYRDPRSLKCPHQFCLECLEKIEATRPNGQITCPTCRAVTPLTPGSQVRDLPKPILANELQELVKQLMEPNQKEKSYKCDNCERGNVLATIHCFGCHENLYDQCYAEHQEVPLLANHKIAPISDMVCCSSHSAEITSYCTDCAVGICNLCARKQYRRHKMEDIEIIALKCRTQIDNFMQRQRTAGVSLEMIDIVQGKVLNIENERDTVVGKLDHTLDLIKTLEDKVKKARSEVVAKTSADINVLELYISDLSELRASQASLLQLGQYLEEKASDPEVVARATELPSPTSIAPATSTPIFSIPVLNDIWEQLYDCLKSPRPLINFKTLSHPEQAKHVTVQKKRKETKPKIPPIAVPLTRLTPKYSVKEDACDVVFNPSRSQLVVRINDKSAPIKVYDLKGNKLTQFGGDIDGLSGDGCISLDSLRDLYLAACDGHLTTVTMDGQRKDRIDMEGCDLKGVTYIKDTDVYIMSDVKNHRVSLIDPWTMSVVRSFGSKGIGAGQFNLPHFITSYTDQGKPVIVVSDCNNRRVQLLDLYGTHLHTYGSYGDGDGQLYRPCGVAADPSGRIIVCDYSNNRVVSFLREDGQDKWQCLIPKEHLQWMPWCIGIDATYKTLAVGNRTVELYSYI